MIFAIALSVALITAGLTGLVRRRALARGTLDVPNERSSHTVPTPRGGGLAMVVSVSAASLWLWWAGIIGADLYAALLGSVAVALLGFVDDRHHLKPSWRLLVHVLAALWALAWLGGLPAIQVGHVLALSGYAGYALGCLGLVWVLNLFNFMDGIDGLAASEAIFVTGAGAALAALGPGASPGVWPAALMVAAACGGFLVWNWPPAKIFMGDVGSGYLGYLVGVLAVAAARTDPAALCAWLILGGVFWCDATVTLVRRVLRRQSPHIAHRTHAYQHLARRWRAHGPVLLLTLAVDFLWLLPWALYAEWHPPAALAATVIALTPLLLLTFVAGAGAAERTSDCVER